MATKNLNYDRLKFLFLLMMLLALALSWVGMRDIPTTPYIGYQVSSDFRVVQLNPSGPAALAGMKLDDKIIEINGTPTERLYQLSRQPEPMIGDEMKTKVLRDGTVHELAFKRLPLPAHQATLTWIYQIMTVFMLVGGLLVFWKKPRKETLLFYMSNYFIALGLMTPPHLGSFLLRNLVAMNSLLFLILGLAFFLHLTIIFPRPKLSVLETPVEIFIYLPVPVMVAFYLALSLFQPLEDLRLNQTLHYVFGLCVLYCLGLSLAAVVHSFWKARSTPQQWTWLLVGSLLGVLPPALLVFRNCFLPKLPLPGSSFYTLMILFAYFAFSWALLREEPKQDSDQFRKAA
jgi:hypothetical protein